MITYEQKPAWQRWGVPASVALTMGLGAYAWWQSRSEEAVPVAASASAASASDGWREVSATRTSKGMVIDAAPGGLDGDLSADEWAILKAAMARQPQGQAEAQRIFAYLRYQYDFEFWQSMIDSPDAIKRHQLAQTLIAQLPERVAQGEFTGAEGVLMGTVLLGDLEADEAKRQQRVDAWALSLNKAAPQPSDEKQLAAKDRMVEFKRRQANAFADWRQLPPAQRTAAQLDLALNEVQRWYASGQP